MASPNAESMLESWVFASPVNQGRWPYLAQEIMRHHILPVARTLAGC